MVISAHHKQSQLAFPNDAFRSEILWSANKGVGLEALLAASEVHQLGISSEIQDHILWLEVAVHDRAAVKILQGQCDAAPKKPGSVFKPVGVSECNIGIDSRVQFAVLDFQKIPLAYLKFVLAHTGHLHECAMLINSCSCGAEIAVC